MTYRESVEYLNALAPRGWRLGLDRMTEFAKRAGLSDVLGGGHTQYIHIAGTNGKGSVTAFVQSILVEAGFRTGAFFSPFVYDLRERVQFGRSLIPEGDFARIATRLRPIAESFSEADYGGVTEFEFKTAIGFEYWREMGCDYVALEVGLGGRLDSTNIVDPACSVIVSIGFDHMAILGDTLGQIAAEKAGIIKPGKPVVVGKMDSEPLAVIQAVAAEQGSPVLLFGRDFDVDPNMHPGICGAMQDHNLAVAVAAIRAARIKGDEAAFKRGAANAYAPGRFERRTYRGREVVLDGAHNAAASTVLCESLQQRYPGQMFALVTGMVAGHDPVTFYEPLRDVIEAAFVAPIDFHRAIVPAALVASLGPDGAKFVPTGSLAEAIENALGTGLPLLVTGSFYLVGEVGRLIQDKQGPEPLDPDPCFKSVP